MLVALCATAVVCGIAAVVIFSRRAGVGARSSDGALGSRGTRHDRGGRRVAEVRAGGRILSVVLAASIAVQIFVCSGLLSRPLAWHRSPAHPLFRLHPIILPGHASAYQRQRLGTSQIAFRPLRQGWSGRGPRLRIVGALSGVGVVGNLGRSALALGQTERDVPMTLARWRVDCVGGCSTSSSTRARLPGNSLGRRLVGARHPAGWIIGGVIGYGLTQLALWVPIILHVPSPLAFVGAWVAEAVVVWALARRITTPILPLPAPAASETRALALTLLLTALVMYVPYRNLGRADESGTRYYRAYFTADFVWHTALRRTRGTRQPRPLHGLREMHYYGGFSAASVLGSRIARAARRVQRS